MYLEYFYLSTDQKFTSDEEICVRMKLFLNNTKFPVSYQSIPQDIVETHELEAITIEYRRECQYSDSIDSVACVFMIGFGCYFAIFDFFFHHGELL